MREVITRIVVAGVLLGCAVVAIARTLPPMPVGPDAPADRFSAVRAARVVETIAAVPRPTGSRELAAARAAVLAELAALGIEAWSARTATWSTSLPASLAPPRPMRSC